MPKIETWDHLPPAVREHLIVRMRDRSISIADLNQLRLWIESKPEVPDGDWYKDFGRSRSAVRGRIPRRSCFAGKPPRAPRSDLASGLGDAEVLIGFH